MLVTNVDRAVPPACLQKHTIARDAAPRPPARASCGPPARNRPQRDARASATRRRPWSSATKAVPARQTQRPRTNTGAAGRVKPPLISGPVLLQRRRAFGFASLRAEWKVPSFVSRPADN
eukprot:6174642-Pleurochrysis_carterae.AAC.1